MANQLYDVLIIGGGPAGLSMATALARQLHTALVIDSGKYRNAPTKHMHNVLGFDHVNPAGFRAKARADLQKRYSSIDFTSATVQTVRKLESGTFEAVGEDGEVYRGRKLGLGTGVRDLVDDQPDGYADCWGRGVFHCLFCHGFEERGAESVGVLASGLTKSSQMLSHVTPMAKRLAQSVTVYTNGDESLALEVKQNIHSSKVHYDSRVITRLTLVDNGPCVKISFSDGTSKTEGFVVNHPSIEQSAPFAEQLGLETLPSGDIKIEPPFNETSVKGCFAAGDTATAFRSVVQAMQMGGFAGVGMVAQLLGELDAKDEI